MGRTKIRERWQLSEIRKYLKTNGNDTLLDSRTVFLSNPIERTVLDRIICQYFWPAVVKALANTPIRILGMSDGFPESEIKDGKHEYTTRSLTIVLEDHTRPMVPGFSPPWYYRGHLECSVLDYMVSSEFFLHLPASFGFRKVRKLLADPMFAGNPPNLSVELGPNQDEAWIVAFREGSGAGWGIGRHEDAAWHVQKKVEQTLEVIRAVTNLEQDYENTRSFKALQTVLREAYQAY